MKPLHLYEIRLLDGTRYRGEIVYKDDQKIVVRLMQGANSVSHSFYTRVTGMTPYEQNLRLFYNGIFSIQDLGWQRVRS